MHDGSQRQGLVSKVEVILYGAQPFRPVSTSPHQSPSNDRPGNCVVEPGAGCLGAMVSQEESYQPKSIYFHGHGHGHGHGHQIKSTRESNNFSFSSTATQNMRNMDITF
ncbi:hypothetical protein PABG_12617 [Paracoccidioides brasiliensis Pb03]|nr:hypothetical protein PABG_12617 [Paracoccidioides brasiliensis Pb03]